MRGRRRVWLAVGSTLSGIALVWTAAGPAAAAGSTLVNESFTGHDDVVAELGAAGRVRGATNDACLTASATGSSARSRLRDRAGSQRPGCS